MAFNSIIRQSTSSLRPLVVQLLKTPRNFHGVLFGAINHNQATLFRNPSFSLNPFAPTFHFSSQAAVKQPFSDDSLVRVIESECGSDQSLAKVIEYEIACAQESDNHDAVQEIPSGFPFKIRDSLGKQAIYLERTYQGEEIKVEVQMPDLVTGEDDDNRDEDDDTERPTQTSVPLVVSVSKKDGPFLEFSCIAYADEITIDHLAVRNPDISDDQIPYEGPDFHDLDENLQKAFRKYLEIRGIKPSTINFLHEYMINKDSREYLEWLKKLKKFMED
ncbi:hypothetical protein L6164_032971 [Bauhinia variegata]|uniref:Uncharacterized protein n=1 Tax=Bauhinia variegata TaxID=167791 RepID=A0ACB9KQJ0_BAUVA|nr:hypothetical protein L6164_032971 [Bauhinia variegata]